MRILNGVSALLLLGVLTVAGCSSDDLVACDVFAKADCLTLYDNFSGGTIDPAKWSQTLSADGEETLTVVGGELQAYVFSSLANSLERARVTIVNGSGVAALAADVRVEVFNMQGTGNSGRARVIGFFYNISPGAVDSTGDVGAVVNMTDTDVNYATFQCNDAACSAAFNQSTPVSIGTVALNSTHTLYLGYNGGTSFTAQLDTNAPVTFDGTVSGAYGGPVGNPFREVGTRISPTSGAGETVTAYFDNVRTGATAP